MKATYQNSTTRESKFDQRIKRREEEGGGRTREEGRRERGEGRRRKEDIEVACSLDDVFRRGEDEDLEGDEANDTEDGYPAKHIRHSCDLSKRS